MLAWFLFQAEVCDNELEEAALMRGQPLCGHVGSEQNLGIALGLNCPGTEVTPASCCGCQPGPQAHRPLDTAHVQMQARA